MWDTLTEVNQMKEQIDEMEENRVEEQTCRIRDDEFEQLKRVIPNVRNRDLSQGQMQ